MFALRAVEQNHRCGRQVLASRASQRAPISPAVRAHGQVAWPAVAQPIPAGGLPLPDWPTPSRMGNCSWRLSAAAECGLRGRWAQGWEDGCRGVPGAAPPPATRPDMGVVRSVNIPQGPLEQVDSVVTTPLRIPNVFDLVGRQTWLGVRPAWARVRPGCGPLRLGRFLRWPPSPGRRFAAIHRGT